MHYFEHYNTFSFHLFNMNFNMIFNENFMKEQWLKPYPTPHYHKTWEIYFIKSGAIDVDCNNEIRRYSAQEFVFIPPYTEHCIVKATEDVDCSNIRFSYSTVQNDIISESVDQLLHKRAFCAVGTSEEIVDTLKKLKQLCRQYVEMTQPKMWMYQKVTSMCLYLMSSLLEVIFAEENAYQENFTAENDSLAMIIEFFMMYDSESNVTVAHLAEALNYSVSQTNRILRQNFGQSFKQLAQDIRVKKAKYFLRKTDFSIKYIAEILGFHETKTFNRFFKAAEGITPTQYRKENGD